MSAFILSATGWNLPGVSTSAPIRGRGNVAWPTDSGMPP